MNNNELNEAVARKLGWDFNHKKTCEHLTVGASYFTFGRHWNHPEYGCRKELPAYSTSIEAAWEILTYCYADLDLKYALTQNPSTLKVHCLIGYTEISADTAPRAICEAFLKLKEKP